MRHREGGRPRDRLSLVLGTLIAVARLLLGRTVAAIPLVGAIEVLRGLPVVVLDLLRCRVLPDVGVDLRDCPAAGALVPGHRADRLQHR